MIPKFKMSAENRLDIGGNVGFEKICLQYSVLVNLTAYGWTSSFSRNFIRIVAFRGTLACHSFACLSYFCGFHFLPAITIIPHSSRKDSNHKQEPTFMASSSSSCYYCSYLYCSLDISYLHVLICNIFFKGIKQFLSCRMSTGLMYGT